MSTGTTSADEARGDARFALSLEVSRPGEPSSFGWTRDVSTGGLKIECGTLLPLGQALRLKLSFPRLLEAFTVDGAVQWTGTIDARGRKGCGVRVWAQRDRQKLEAVVRSRQVPRSTHRVLVADPRAFHDPRYRSLRERVPELDVTVAPAVECARSLREHRVYDTIVLDAALRDSRGEHVLSELLIGDGAPFGGMLIACSGNSNALRLARQLGAPLCLRGRVEYERLVTTLARLLQRHSFASMRRVQFL